MPRDLRSTLGSQGWSRRFWGRFDQQRKNLLDLFGSAGRFRDSAHTKCPRKGPKGKCGKLVHKGNKTPQFAAIVSNDANRPKVALPICREPGLRPVQASNPGKYLRLLAEFHTSATFVDAMRTTSDTKPKGFVSTLAVHRFGLHAQHRNSSPAFRHR